MRTAHYTRAQFSFQFLHSNYCDATLNLFSSQDKLLSKSFSVNLVNPLRLVQWVPNYPDPDYPDSRLSERLDVTMFSAAVGKRRSGHWSSATRESKAAV